MKVSKFKIVQNYFYGRNDPILQNKEFGKVDKVLKYEDLIIYRGIHICNS